MTRRQRTVINRHDTFDTGSVRKVVLRRPRSNPSPQPAMASSRGGFATERPMRRDAESDLHTETAQDECDQSRAQAEVRGPGTAPCGSAFEGCRFPAHHEARRWWRHEPPWLIRTAIAELMLAGLLGALFLWGGSSLESTRAERLDRLENLRFVRSVAALPAERKQLAELDLRGQNLSGLDLSGADLRGSDLQHADLTGANLSAADLTGADLSDALLTATDLSNANLSSARMSGGDFTNAILAGATLFRSVATGADLSDADLRGARIIETKLNAAILLGADLAGVTLTDSDLSQVDLRHGVLARAVLEETDLSGSCFDEATVWPEFFEPSAPECNGYGPIRPRIVLRRGLMAGHVGYWYNIELVSFAPNHSYTVTCRDDADPQGFGFLFLSTDGAGASTPAQACFSGESGDHWATVDDVTSNRVRWSLETSEGSEFECLRVRSFNVNGTVADFSALASGHGTTCEFILRTSGGAAYFVNADAIAAWIATPEVYLCMTEATSLQEVEAGREIDEFAIPIPQGPMLESCDDIDL